MISRIIIVQHRFGLMTPKTQRMLAAAKVYIQYGVDVCFIYSSSNENTAEELYPNIHFIRIPENGRFDIKSYWIFIKTIKSLYSKRCAILFYDVPYYSFLFKAHKYNVFAEVTEVPLFGKKTSFFKRILSYVSLKAVCGFTGLFVISKALEEYYKGKGVSNIEVINMFVDKQRFECLKKSSEQKYIGYCGTISTHKDGVDDLIRAFALFVKDYPDYTLNLFGRFENDIVHKTLECLVVKLNISSSVVFSGPVKSEDLPQKLVNASILTLARPDNKQAQFGFPTKLGEYLATGNPVVITSVGDIPLFLKDQHNALLVEPGDYCGFAEKLKWIVQHPMEANEIGKKGKELVDTAFSSESQIKKALCFINRSSL